MVVPREDMENSLLVVLLHVNAIFLTRKLSEIQIICEIQIIIHLTKSTLHFVGNQCQIIEPEQDRINKYTYDKYVTKII